MGASKLLVFPLSLGMVLAPVARADELTSVQSYVSQFNQASGQIQCPQPPLDGTFASCQACMGIKGQVQSNLNQQISGALHNTAGANVGGVGSAVAGNAIAQASGTQKGGEVGHSAGTAGAGSALKNKSISASNAAGAFESCANNMRGSCTMIGPMQGAADAAIQACQQGAEHSKAIAAEKAGSGLGMDDLSKLAGAAAQALGPLASMLGQKGAGDTGAGYTPYTPSAYDSGSGGGSKVDTTQAGVDGTKLGDGEREAVGGNSNILSPNDNATGASLKPGTGNDMGLVSPASGRYGADPSLAAALGGSDYGSSEGSPDPAVAGASGGGAGGGGASGGRNSSGSSVAGDLDKAAAGKNNGEGSNYEVNLGGGGGGKSFLGLKGKATDLSELGMDAGAANAGTVGNLGLEEGARELASDDTAAGIAEEDGSSLFHAVHTKYSEIKKRGSI